MTITPGLCSVTLRALDPARVVRVASAAGLPAIEWGGDVHVPAGDLAAARRVRALTVDAGLRVAAYGSYFRPGVDDAGAAAAVVETALALRAPRIRLWAGGTGSAVAGEQEWRAVVAGARAVAEPAARAGVAVAFEYHAGTLADTPSAAVRLADLVHPGGPVYWQPPLDRPDEECVAEVEVLASRLSAVHVFSCWPGAQRRPLADRQGMWSAAFAVLRRSDAVVDALLEFVTGDDPAAVIRDARVLRRLAGSERS